MCRRASVREEELSLNLLGALPAGGGDVSPLGGESGAEALPAALHEGALPQQQGGGAGDKAAAGGRGDDGADALRKRLRNVVLEVVQAARVGDEKSFQNAAAEARRLASGPETGGLP